MVNKRCFLCVFLLLTKNVIFMFYFKGVNVTIILAASRLEAQMIKTTDITEYKDVFSQRHSRNELQCCATQCESNPDKGEQWVCKWCDSMQGNRSRKPRWKRHKGTDGRQQKASVYLVMMLGI